MLDPTTSLYHRLGGYDALAAAIDDLLPRLTGDAQLGVYWRGKCTENMRKHRQLLVDFAVAATGGPALYSGLDMKTSHTGLGISESDWRVLLAHITATLEDLGVAPAEKEEFLTLVGTLKGEIIEEQAAGTVA